MTAKIRPRSLTLGRWATLSGSVTPIRPGKVTIQRRDGTSWTNVATRRLNSSGAYNYRFLPTKAGRLVYRVRMPAVGSIKAGVSPRRTLTVYRWLWLSDLPLADALNSDYINKGSMSINGITYPHSIWIRVENQYNMWGEWDLARKCTTFDATIGIGDTSDSGTEGGLDAYSDDLLLYDKVEQFGSSEIVTTPLYSGLRLRLQGIYTGSSGITRVTWGNARIRCSF